MAAAFACPHNTWAVAWTFDSVTYTPPAGFSPVTGGPADREEWKRVDGARSCEIAVFWAVDATPDAIADHARQWSRIADALFHTGPGIPPSARTLPSGAQLVAGIGMGRFNGVPVVVTLFTVRGAGRVTPVLILTPTAEALKDYTRSIEGFTASLIAHPSWQRPANLPSEPLPVRIADLAGTWQRGSGNVINYVNSWGAITGSNTTFFNEVLTVAPDGGYQSSMAGMTSGRVVRDKIAGKWILDGEFLVVTQPGYSNKRLRFALLVEGADGTVIGLSPADKPVSLGTINGAGEFWVRKKGTR
ncbi:MAG TPA: hypothetical protein VKU01_08220 [Bryobacteraceae bacterium]|nr:hypothetical protein [Bryobacteraceae bacterium]